MCRLMDRKRSSGDAAVSRDDTASHDVARANEITVFENKSLCRICHLSEKEISCCAMELMEIGCGCNGDLRLAHSYCAEAWFRFKGNRLCEICGERAKNITGIVDNRFMEEWNEGESSISDKRTRCSNRRPLCHLSTACLVIAFLLPWFFRASTYLPV